MKFIGLMPCSLNFF